MHPTVYAATFAEDAARLALSFPNPALLAGLAAAVADFPDGAFEAAARTTAHCRRALLDAGLEVLTEPGQGTLVAFRAIGDPAEIVQRAEANDVVVRNLPNGSRLLRLVDQRGRHCPADCRGPIGTRPGHRRRQYDHRPGPPRGGDPCGELAAGDATRCHRGPGGGEPNGRQFI